jgi:hypothetical protein
VLQLISVANHVGLRVVYSCRPMGSTDTQNIHFREWIIVSHVVNSDKTQCYLSLEALFCSRAHFTSAKSEHLSINKNTKNSIFDFQKEGYSMSRGAN